MTRGRGRARILLVGNESAENMRAVSSIIYPDPAVEFITAQSIEEAATRLARDCPDAVVCECTIREKTWLDMLIEELKRGVDAPLIVLDPGGLGKGTIRAVTVRAKEYETAYKSPVEGHAEVLRLLQSSLEQGRQDEHTQATASRWKWLRESLPFELMIVDVNGRILEAGHADMSRTRHPVGLSLFDVIPARIRREIKRLFSMASSSGTVQEFNTDSVRGDADTKAMTLTIVPMLEDGKVHELAVLIRELNDIDTPGRTGEPCVSGPQMAEGPSFRDLFDNLPEWTILWKRHADGSVTIDGASRATLAYHKERGFHLPGKSLDELYSHIPDVKLLVERAFDTEGLIETTTSFTSIIDGANYHSRFQCVRINADTVLLVVTDLTEEKLREELLSRQREELSEFAHSMAHDLRNAFHTILGYAALLHDETKDERVDAIVRIVERVERTISQSVALADAGLVIGRRDRVRLADLISTASKSAFLSGVTIRAKRLPTIECDSVKMLQVIENLLSNAVEHGKARTIEVSTVREDDSLSILISNDGEPIPASARSRIFVDGFTTKTGGGRGLGIVKRIVEAHGWTVELAPTEKTTFRIRIPRQSRGGR
ncbi:MAG: HAMP domain-containing histidine kinase [Candidatus Thorarchaeota archaeon]|nr:HAMP domain-containing histidine kinase [Candidatus Thorarchaeota archaeon]